MMSINRWLFGLILLLLIMAGALLASGLLMDQGYVFIRGFGWQLQTNLSVWVLLNLLFAVLVVLVLLLLGTLMVWPARRHRAKQRQMDRQRLETLERAALYQVLHDPQAAWHALHPLEWSAQHPVAQLLKTHLALEAGMWAQVDADLKGFDADYDDFALLMQANSLLQKGEVAQARAWIHVLYQQEPQGLRARMPQAFLQALHHVWWQSALVCPWSALQDEHRPITLSTRQWQAWLEALYQSHHVPTLAEQHLLLSLFDAQSSESRQAMASIWIALLLLCQEGQGRAWSLAHQILKQRLDVSILAYWTWLVAYFAQPLGDQSAQILLDDLERRYPAQPAVLLARAYGLWRNSQSEKAEQLVRNWPNNQLYERLLGVVALEHLPQKQARLMPMFFHF